MSFQITLAPNQKAAARFVGRVRRRLQRALADNPEISRADIARDLGVHRSVVTRQLQGTADMSIGRVAEIARSLGYRPKFELEKLEPAEGSNVGSDDLYRKLMTTAGIKITTNSTAVNESVELPRREPV